MQQPLRPGSFRTLFITLFFLGTLAVQEASASSINGTDLTTPQNSSSQALTLYYNGALFYENSAFELKKGMNNIIIENICPALVHGSIFLEAPNAKIESYSYTLRPISTVALLNAFLGKRVFLTNVEKNCCLKKAKKGATLLSFKNDKALVETDGGIFQIEISKIVFPSVPSWLSNSPKIKARIWSPKAGIKPVGLFYLSRRLGWTAEYAGLLSKSEDRIDVEAYAFLKNDSNYKINNAVLRLIAGKVNFELRPNFPVRRVFEAKAMAAAPQQPSREQIFEHHMYKIPEPVTLFPRQSKHIALFHVGNVPCRKKLVFRTNASYYYRRSNRSVKRIHPDIILEVEASKAKADVPFPAGVFRVYKKDSEGSSLFMGEHRISDTPPGEKIVLDLGKAFDVTATKKQTNFNRIKAGDRYSYRYDSSYEIEIHNPKDQSVSIILEENIPGDWTITEENIPHRKENAHLAVWTIEVPAKGQKLLKYSVRVWD